MRYQKTVASVLGAALLAVALSGCAGTKQTLDNPDSAYIKQKDSLPTMVKQFSGPNLAIILGGLKIKGDSLKVYDEETTASMRSADHQALDLLRETTFKPEMCQQKLIASYTDKPEIPSAFSQANLNNHATVVRSQLRAYPSVAQAQKAIQVQRDLAQACPTYAVTAPGGASSQQTTAAADYPLDGAQDGLMMTYGTDRGEGQIAPTEVGVFQRVGNLEIRVYFDGKNPVMDANEARAELQEFVTYLGQALIAKAK